VTEFANNPSRNRGGFPALHRTLASGEVLCDLPALVIISVRAVSAPTGHSCEVRLRWLSQHRGIP